MKHSSVLLLLCLAAFVPAQTADPAVALDGMAKGYYLPVAQVAFGTFSYEYTGLPTPFARWVEERLAAAKCSHVRIINRSATVASSLPFTDTPGDFSYLGGKARATMTRAISVAGTAKAETAEASASYSIGP